MTEVLLKKYKVQATGADGGHNYIVAELAFEGAKRKLVVLFADKSEELGLNEKKPIKVKGEIKDSGVDHDLIMTDAEVIVP